jgi:hypothetical protein
MCVSVILFVWVSHLSLGGRSFLHFLFVTARSDRTAHNAAESAAVAPAAPRPCQSAGVMRGGEAVSFDVTPRARGRLDAPLAHCALAAPFSIVSWITP